MFDALLADARHFLAGSFYLKPVPITPARVVYLAISQEFRLAASYRATNWLHRRGHLRTATFLQRLSHSALGSDISPAATIAPGVCFVHGTDIVIGAEAVVGPDTVIFNGVTLGKRKSTNGEPDGMPKIGAGVLLATGAKLFGPIEVGDRARVGANSVVLKSVPAGATAVGAPARVLRHEGTQATAKGANGATE